MVQQSELDILDVFERITCSDRPHGDDNEI